MLLGPNGPRLIDFGIARAVDATRLTATGAVIGTPAFMSPEQADGRDAGVPSEVFFFGGVICYALLGRGPHGRGNPVVLLRRLLDEEPDVGDITAPLRAIVTRCLARNLADRPTAAELVRSVRRPGRGRRGRGRMNPVGTPSSAGDSTRPGRPAFWPQTPTHAPSPSWRHEVGSPTVPDGHARCEHRRRSPPTRRAA